MEASEVLWNVSVRKRVVGMSDTTHVHFLLLEAPTKVVRLYDLRIICKR